MTDQNAASGDCSDHQLTALIALYNEHNTDARWQEECREKSSSAIIAANSVIVGIIAALGLQFSCIIFCIVQFILANTGQRFILKYHALSERRHAYVNGLQKMIIQDGDIGKVQAMFKEAREGQFARLKDSSKVAVKLMQADDKTSIHELWYDLHNGFKVISFLLACIIIAVDLQKGANSTLLQAWQSISALLTSFGVNLPA